jgi:GT2 family glycosyltransferase
MTAHLPVAIGYVHPLQVTALFMRSVIATRDRMGNLPIYSAMSGPNISRARNMIVQNYLDLCDAEYLFMVDTDMVFGANAVERLLEHQLPIVSGLCLTGEEQPRPSMYKQIADVGKIFQAVTAWDTDELISVDAVGSACTLIHREVFERIRTQIPNKAAHWYQEVQRGSELVGEDFTFCMRAREVGFKIFCDTAVQVGHIKGSMHGIAN